MQLQTKRTQLRIDWLMLLFPIIAAALGQGQETALLFAKEGANVVVNDISDVAQRTCDMIIENGGKAIFVKKDVSKVEDCKAIVDAAVEAFGQIDVLANIAGIIANGSVETAEIDDWQRSMDVNVKSVFLLSKFAVPYLRKTKGCIVNVSSAVALMGVKNRAIYSATKAAVLGLTRQMAAEYIEEGIRVNAICPGAVLSPSLQKRIDATPNPEETLKMFESRQPMGRLGTPEELAKAIVFAANPEVGFMTGATLCVDGGHTSM